MSNFQDNDCPPILRPIPRRPFNVNFVGSALPDEKLSQPPSPQPRPGGLNLEFLNSKLLNSRLQSVARGDDYTTGSSSASISRAQSVKNLTASTLFGIYSPTTTGFTTQDEPSTPFCLDPPSVPLLSAEDLAYALQKNSAHMAMQRRKLSQHAPPPSKEPLSTPVMAFHLALRALLLFGLGILYGALVAQFQDRRKYAALQMDDTMQPLVTYDLRYMAFWGVSGVVLGGLLPLFDDFWENICGHESAVEDEPLNQTRNGEVFKGTSSPTDWALVARGIGAFIGIVYAIRKLTWTSTLQVSLTLALVNPFLWYLIDGTPAGFLFSAAIGLAGSLVLTGLQADVVPAPASASSIFDSFGAEFHLNASSSTHAAQQSGGTLVLGGLATKESVEMVIWTLSVLFCCGVCFGNIGRRMMLRKSSSGKGRWAEGNPR